jgi:hypothetical protein
MKGSIPRWATFTAALVAGLGFAADAAACPSCPTSRLVSAAVCADDLWRNLGAIGAPFVVFGLVVWRLHGIGKTPRAPRPEYPA